MTGPEHYREAERLLAVAKAPYTTIGISAEGVKAHEDYLARTISAAQVHATLAVASASVLNGEYMSNKEFAAWQEAAS